MVENSLRAAVDLVLRDAWSILGRDGVSVVVVDDPDALQRLEAEDPRLLDILTGPIAPGPAFAAAVVYVPGEARSTGIGERENETFAHQVARVADLVQETVMESDRNYARAFPPCRTHHSHPMWPAVRDGRAVWTCPDDRAVQIEMGTLDNHP